MSVKSAAWGEEGEARSKSTRRPGRGWAFYRETHDGRRRRGMTGRWHRDGKPAQCERVVEPSSRAITQTGAARDWLGSMRWVDVARLTVSLSGSAGPSTLGGRLMWCLPTPVRPHERIAFPLPSHEPCCWLVWGTRGLEGGVATSDQTQPWLMR